MRINAGGQEFNIVALLLAKCYKIRKTEVHTN
jgi:hypothetical protein